MKRWRSVFLAGLVLLLAGLGLWLSVDHGAASSVVAAKPAASAPADEAEERPPGPAWALASLARREADAADRRLILDAAELQRLDEADCQRMAPAMRQLPAGEYPAGPDFTWEDAASESDAWLRRWTHALRQRGDERSLATADFLQPLLTQDDMAASDPAVRRLYQRALRSGDGFVLALAAARRCAPAAVCDLNALHERWKQLEPGNISAWLASVPSSRPLPEPWIDGLMKADHDNSHRAELMALLLSLPPQVQPGPRRLARDVALMGVGFSLGMPPFSPLTEHCRAGNDAPRCRALAEKLWTLREPSLINWMLTLGLARQSPPISPVWEPRARQAEAAQQWSRDDAERMIGEPSLHAYQCKPDPSFERWMHALMTAGEGAAMLAEIKVRGLDVEQLSAKYRQQNGRSLLQARK